MMLNKKIDKIIKYFRKIYFSRKIGFDKKNNKNYVKLEKQMFIKQENEVLKEIEKTKIRLEELQQHLKNINVKE